MKRVTRVLAAGLAVALCVPGQVLALPASTVPTLPTSPSFPAGPNGLTPTQQELSGILALRQQVMAQISLLEPRVEMATEEYNNANDQLDRTQAQLEEAQKALALAETDLQAQRQAFNERLVAVYRTGDYGVMELFLSIDSVSELITRLDFLVKMGDRDAETLKSLALQEQEAEGTRDQLAALQQQHVALQIMAAQRKAEVEKLLAEQKALQEKLDQEFREVLAQQLAEQQAQQAQMLESIKSASSRYGIVVQPGSPVETVLTYLGIPYVWGGEDPDKGFDCSGLVMYVFRQHGVELPHYSRAQFGLGLPVESVAELLPGDLVFFGSPIHHVGMYIGGGYYVHAPKTGDFVKISKLADRGDYAGARRYPWVYKITAPGTADSASQDGSGE